MPGTLRVTVAPRRTTTAMKPSTASLLIALLCLSGLAAAEPIGEVDTVFKFIGPDHKIVVDAHDDPKVTGVTCYVSRAKTGGISGALRFSNGCGCSRRGSTRPMLAGNSRSRAIAK